MSNIGIQEIAHFLLVNSEAINTTKDDYAKMALLQFLFSYAHKHEKQHYADFAFELLQERLSKELRKQDIEDDHNDPIFVGHGLMYFIKNGFFESDEFDDILKPFDSLAIHKTERLSRGGFSPDNVHGLLLVADYLLNRMDCLDKDADHAFSIREHLLISFFELVHHLGQWDSKDITWILSMEILFKKGLDRKETARLSKKGLKQLQNGILPRDDKALKQYTFAKKKGNLDKALLLFLCFSEKTEDIENDRESLWEALETRTSDDMEQLYGDGEGDSFLSIQRIIIYALVLINETTSKTPDFLLHHIIKLIKNNEKT